MAAATSAEILDIDPLLRERRPPLRLNRSEDNEESRIILEGALDAVTARDIQIVLDAVVAARPRRVTIDLAKVTVLDSSGVGAIVWLFKRMRARGGRVAIAGASAQPLAVLKLLKLDRVLCE